MDTSTKIAGDNEALANEMASHAIPRDEDLALDRKLSEIRSGRRLEKLVASIQGFLNGQVARLEKGLDECQAAADNDQIMRTLLASFETQKRDWQEKCDAESRRLSLVGETLAEGWKELEDQRRKLQDERGLS